MDTDDLLPDLPLASLSRRQLAQLSDQLAWRTYPSGGLILPARAPINFEGVVYHGKVKVAIVSNGHRHMVAQLREGDVINRDLQARYTSPIELRAQEDTLLCLRLAQAKYTSDTSYTASPTRRVEAPGTPLHRIPNWTWARLGRLVLASLLLLAVLWVGQSIWRNVLAQIVYGIASLQIESGHPTEALSLLQTSIMLDPHAALAQNDLGYLYFQQGQIQTAQQSFRQAITDDPDLAVTQNNLGMSYLVSGQWDRARDALKQATVLNPEDVRVWLNLGIAAQGTGKAQEAIQAYRSTLRLDPANITALLNLSTLYYEQRAFSDADRYLKKAVSIHPDLPQAQMLIGAIALENKDFDSARSALQAAAPRLGNDPLFHFFRGLWYEEQQLPDKATKEFQRVLALSPEHGLANLTRSHLSKLTSP